MEIFAKLGINGPIFLAQIVNFFLLLYVLKRLLYRPILNILKEREAKIKKGLLEAEKAEIKLKEVRESVEEKMKEATKEVDRILARAYKEGEKERNEMFIQAKEDIDKMKEDMMKEFKKERENIVAEVRSETGKLVIEIVKKIIPGKIGEKEEQEWMKEIEGEIEK